MKHCGFDVDIYDYDLPSELIAQFPLENRSEAKLLVLNKDTGETEHSVFKSIVNYLRSDDVLVLNDTKVIPARILGKKCETNALIEVLLLKELSNDTWECLVKHQKRLKSGIKIVFSDELTGECVEILDDGITHIKFYYEGIFLNIIDSLGEAPLPPYIHKKLEDKNKYQTVYAKHLGSVAAPTAGLHFTESLLKEIENKGVEILRITLNVGLGTFRPVSTQDITKHKMHSECYEISESVAKKLNEAKKNNKRIICVGTTCVRTLESNINKYGEFKATKEETSIFIYPPYKFKAVDALVTNFHLPKSTLLMLVSAFCSKKLIFNAYKEAIKNNYRFFSFGDAMFITTNDNRHSLKTYKKILKNVNADDYYYKGNGFKIQKGYSNVLLSAPHAYKHNRKGNIKTNEYNTSNLVKLLYHFTKCNIIYTTKDNDFDSNSDINNEYINETINFIKENNINYFIDIHGISNDYEYDIEIGTNDGDNINENYYLLEKIVNLINDDLTSKVVVDKKYKAGPKRLSSLVNKKTGVFSIQLEIAKDLRKMKKRPVAFTKTVKVLERIVDKLESGE